jgi:pimeloyl-ACP methyl ester carboxylesterase
MFVPIGNIEQWIQFGGDAPDHPILLFLHGGPGGTTLPASAAWRCWEEHFTIVHWNQRGAGRTFGRNGEAGCGSLTVDRMIGDGIEVTEHLLGRFDKSKVLLVGHSWGSALGVHMLKRRPELFSAFVGTGQLVNMSENEEVNYRRYREQAERQGNQEALSELRALGPPPYPDRTTVRTVREWADKLAEGDSDSVQMRPSPSATDITPDDISFILKGLEFSVAQLFDELWTIDLPSLGLSFEVPMFFFHGACDQQTPIEVAEQYFSRIAAPHKEFVRFEGCHHFVAMNRPRDFLRELVTRVRPLI